MKKVYFKYIESLIFIVIFVGLIYFKINNQTEYLIDFNFGILYYLFLLIVTARVLISFIDNKKLKYIFKSRLVGVIIFVYLIANLMIILTMKEYSYTQFLLLSLEKYKFGAIFASIFGKLYEIMPKSLMLGISAVLIPYMFLYVTGKLIGFYIRLNQKKKTGEYEKIKEDIKEKKEKKKRLKEEIKKKREIELEKLDETIKEDFIDDIKNEIQTRIHKKENKEEIMGQKRSKIYEELLEKHEERKDRKVNSDAEITFIEREQTYPRAYVEISKGLGISLEKLDKAVELVHNKGVKGSRVLAKELELSEDEAERVYIKVRRMRDIK